MPTPAFPETGDQIAPVHAGNEHRTVSRITTILEAAAANPGGVRLTQLTELLEAPKSSVFTLVKGLVSCGYLTEERATYWLGPAVHALLDVNRPALDEVARPFLVALHAEYNETVMLSTPVGNSIAYLMSIESTQMIRYSAPLRIRRPMWPTSTGKCLLAYQPARRRARLLRAWFSDEQKREQVEAELDLVRSSGIATVHDELHPDVSATAAVILVDDKAIASIGMAGPTQRMMPKLPDAGRDIQAACRSIAAKMRPAPPRGVGTTMS